MSNKMIGVIVLLVAGAILALSPAGLRQARKVNPKELTATITSGSNFVAAEDLAAWLIDKRPDLLVVDLRSSEDYNLYHIPGAINIPLAKLFYDESLSQLNDEDYVIVLYSNGATYSAQAWILLQEQGIDAYVLQGGLNYWASAILNPEKPGDSVADDELLKYNFRKAASAYFNRGGVTAGESQQPAAKPKPRKLKPRKKRSGGAEGC